MAHLHYDIHTGVKKAKTKVIVAIASLGVVLGGGSLSLALVGAANAASGNHGFDEFGYNNSARVFVGTGSSWCQGKLGMSKTDCDDYMGAYANDQLVMKWNAAWDACNDAGNNDVDACLGATLTNEWNGNVPGGSGETEHFKCIWVGSEGESSPYYRDGGYVIWNNYEAIMDQGKYADHTNWVAAHALPSGFGVN
jgi:hypothetical protein